MKFSWAEFRRDFRRATGETPSRQLSIDFSEAAWKTLQQLSRSSGRDITEVISHALVLARWHCDLMEIPGHGAAGISRRLRPQSLPLR